ncbi:ATP-binding protein [Kosakonia pseudosacchari]|uniref:ATP-binding protein n=1 Tax=Kosakonia pseudosacchari TaxID=1646340 RepID=A0ABX4ISU8_9ENTR|nr:ATP-binding protein [Kosakonia pseudosacchari]PDO88424.1 ATP-binding protein [Kosakonia pseudosacchari]
MKNEIYLSSFSLAEPADNFYFYAPHWLNAWEAHLYNQALKSTSASGWAFKRFGTDKETYAREMIRKPRYIDYIESMEQTADAALQQMTPRDRMLLLKSRAAFIYIDTWGESSVFENITSALHTATIDTLPKNILKKFSIKNVTCKIRGENFSLIQAMQLAQDYLHWNVFDFVVICGAYRAIPVLVFSDEDIPGKRGRIKTKHKNGVQLSVERTGCFIFSLRESALRVNCGKYVAHDNLDYLQHEITKDLSEGDLLTFLGRKENITHIAPQICIDIVDLKDIYGASGCLTPALSWEYLLNKTVSSKKMRTVLADKFGGYSYFDTLFSAG